MDVRGKRQRANSPPDSNADSSPPHPDSAAYSMPPLPPLSVPSAKLTDQCIIDSLQYLKDSGVSAPPPSIDELDLEFSILQVQKYSAPDVADKIDTFLIDVSSHLISTIHVPSRSDDCHAYVKVLDRIVLKKGKYKSYKKNVGKARVIIDIMDNISEICHKDMHISLRSLFYRNPKLYKNQGVTDSCVHDVACIIECTRSSLNLFPMERGRVIGRLVYREGSRVVDCTQFGIGGSLIPFDVDTVGDMSSDASFILLVEKHVVFTRLAEDEFYNKYGCIIVTGEGQPDVGTRMFLKKIKAKLNLRVLALVDADMYGMMIMSTYLFGSQNMSYDSENLVTPDIMWLGLRHYDIEKHNIPKESRKKMNKKEIKKALQLADKECIQSRTEWRDELLEMCKLEENFEIEALNVNGPRYISEVYLPTKLRQRDWI